MLHEFARIGVDSLRSLVHSDDVQKAHAANTNETIYSDDKDSVLGTPIRCNVRDTSDQHADCKPDTDDFLSLVKDITVTTTGETTKVDKCEEYLQRQFPAANVVMVKSCKSEEESSDSRQTNLIKHLGDLVDYATKPPADDEFDSRQSLGKSWALSRMQEDWK